MTTPLLINEISILAFGALLAAAAVEDVRSLTIPNRIPLGIIILYPAYVLSAGVPVDWQGAALLAGGALAVGLVLFSFNYAGGGDVKLFVASCLWAGPALFPKFLLVTALVGAAISIGMLAHRRFGARVPLGAAHGSPPVAGKRAGRQRDLPYGAAIAAGGIQVVVTLLVGA